MHNNYSDGGYLQKHIADIARAAAEQHSSSSTCIVEAPEQRQSSGRRSRSSTSCLPEAAPGRAVERGESPVAYKEEKHSTISQVDLLREMDCVSSSSSSRNSNSKTTQQVHEAAAAEHHQQQQKQQSSGNNSSSIAHHARPRPLSALQSRQGSTVGPVEGRKNGAPDGASLYWVSLVSTEFELWVRVSPSAYSIRFYSSRHDGERHNHTLEGQQRNLLQDDERNAHIHACM